MAIFIEIGVEWLEGSKFPKINITFKKDTSLFDFLKPSKSKGGNKKEFKTTKKEKVVVEAEEEEDVDYIEKCLFGTAFIKYGENAETIATRKFTIQALKDVDKYYYYHPDSGAKIKLISGFNSSYEGFKKLREYNSWDGTGGSGSFSGLHRVALPLFNMKKGQNKKMRYDFRLKGHYQETLPEADIVSHYFYFRMQTDVYGANLSFCIPNGKESDIIKFKLEVEDRGKILCVKEIQNIDSSYFLLDKNSGSGWISIQKRRTTIHWHIPSVLRRGFIYRMIWFTERREGS